MQHCFTENEFERGKLHKRNISIIGVLANLPFTIVFFATVCLWWSEVIEGVSDSPAVVTATERRDFPRWHHV